MEVRGCSSVLGVYGSKTTHRAENVFAHPHFTEPLGAQYGVRAICGKGGFPDEAIEPMQRLGMVYLAIVGGAAALETTQIEEIEEVAWEELMPECLWKFRVRDFGPLTVPLPPIEVRAPATTIPVLGLCNITYQPPGVKLVGATVTIPGIRIDPNQPIVTVPNVTVRIPQLRVPLSTVTSGSLALSVADSILSWCLPPVLSSTKSAALSMPSAILSPWSSTASETLPLMSSMNPTSPH